MKFGSHTKSLEKLVDQNQESLETIYSLYTSTLKHKSLIIDNHRYLAIMPSSVLFKPVYYPPRRQKGNNITDYAKINGCYERYFSILNTNYPPKTSSFGKAINMFTELMYQEIGILTPTSYLDTLKGLRPTQRHNQLCFRLNNKTKPNVKTEQGSGVSRLFWTCPQEELAELRTILNAFDTAMKNKRKHSSHSTWVGGFVQSNFCGLNNKEQADNMKLFQEFTKLNGLTAGEWDFSRCDARIPSFAYDLLRTVLCKIFPKSIPLLERVLPTIYGINVTLSIDQRVVYLNTLFANISGARTTTLLNTLFNLFDQFYSHVMSGKTYAEAWSLLGPSGGDDACVVYNSQLEPLTRSFGSRGDYVPIWSPSLGYTAGITMLGRFYVSLEITPCNVARYTNLGKFNVIYAGSCQSPLLALKRRLEGYKVTDSTSYIWDAFISMLWRIYDLDKIGTPIPDKELEYKKNLGKSHYPYNPALMHNNIIVSNLENYFNRPMHEIHRFRMLLTTCHTRLDLWKLKPYFAPHQANMCFGVGCSFPTP